MPTWFNRPQELHPEDRQPRRPALRQHLLAGVAGSRVEHQAAHGVVQRL